LSYPDTGPNSAIAAVDGKASDLWIHGLESLSNLSFRVDFCQLTYRKTPISSRLFWDTSGDYILMEEFVQEETERQRDNGLSEIMGMVRPIEEVKRGSI